MKDLLLFVADADVQAFMSSLLQRPEALGIRPIQFAIQRHPSKDSGMAKTGAELTRFYKKQFARLLMMWDHHGSGCDHKKTPEQVRAEVQDKLDAITWSGKNCVNIFVPELEQWLWYCKSALLTHCKIQERELADWLEKRAEHLGKTVAELQAEQPKELFEYVMRDCLKRTISPKDFEEIGKIASTKGLMQCENFRATLDALRAWFPA